MASPTFAFYRDLIMTGLAEVSKYVTDAELGAVMAEINREILSELRLTETLSVGTMSYALLDQHSHLPADCLEVKRVMINEGDEERWIDVVAWEDTGKRQAYERDGRGYAYCIGRTFYLSWDVAATTTINIYYYPFPADAQFAFTTEVALGTTTSQVPIWAGKALRYGTMADLMIVHAATQLHEYKASRWQSHYEKILGRLGKMNTEIMPSHQSIPRGPF